MSNATLTHATNPTDLRRERRKVVAASMIGTTIEWYDFFIYASSAALVFNTLFFEPAGAELGLLISFATIGLSFLFRPLGAMICGHLGDLFGRKRILVATLVMMGVATFLVGLLPTYHDIGIMAPILLASLRILQGLSAGGEWGGAALMAVEYAPTNKRGAFGVAPQVATPIAMLLASGVIALMTIIAPGDAYLEWGWRVPFMLSALLVVVGLVVRHSVEESPVFREMEKKSQKARVPLATLFRRHTPLVLIAALTFAGNNGAGYMIAGGFIQNQAVAPTNGNMNLTAVLISMAISSASWGVFTVIGGFLSDRIGRRATYLIGWTVLLVAIFPMLWSISSQNVVTLTVGVSFFAAGLGLNYGPQSAYFAELFPASVRYSGASISYALGAILGGAFAPLIATALVQATGSTTSVGIYLIGLVLVATIATLLLRERRGIPLDAAHEEEQAKPPFIWAKR
jgi:MFS family permease